MLKDFIDVFQFLSKSTAKRVEQDKCIQLRAKYLPIDGTVKVAFDTRRINQETDYIPRRGLQNYHRSAAFITQATADKIVNFKKIKETLEELKSKYGREPEWQDSYCRILLNCLDKSIGLGSKSGDFNDNQPSMASLDYLEELLYTRYRLELNNIQKLGKEEIKGVLLSKDEMLIRKNILTPEPMKNMVANGDQLVQALFGNVKAIPGTSVKRSVNITIEDQCIEKDDEK